MEFEEIILNSDSKLMHEYYRVYKIFEEKYGVNNFVLLMREGTFYEVYQCDKINIDYDIKNIAYIFNYRVTLSNKSEPESIDNPKMVGVPMSTLHNNIKRLIE